MRNVLLLFLISTLFGCSTVSPTAVTKIFDSSGRVVAELTGAAVQRDYLYTSQHINRDNNTKMMYPDSGAKVEFMPFQEVTPGVWMQPIKSVSTREAPRFQQNLETRPPDHRGWDSLDNFVSKGLQGYIAWVLGDTWKGTDKLDYGRGNNFSSYNPVSTAEPYFAPIN